MQITPIQQQITPTNNSQSRVEYLCNQLGKNTQLPNGNRNYPLFNFGLVNEIVSHKESAIPQVLNILSKTNEEKTICEGLYTLDRMIDSGVKDIGKTYPIISRFNNTSSPNIQVLLAGIYRKTQVPDGFGPLIKMMVKDTFAPPTQFFDPTEEIGGAILEYLRNNSAIATYQK